MKKTETKNVLKLPKCRVLQMKMCDGVFVLVENHPSIEDAARKLRVKPETMYAYCRAVGETLKGSYFMAY